MAVLGMEPAQWCSVWPAHSILRGRQIVREIAAQPPSCAAILPIVRTAYADRQCGISSLPSNVGTVLSHIIPYLQIACAAKWYLRFYKRTRFGRVGRMDCMFAVAIIQIVNRIYNRPLTSNLITKNTDLRLFVVLQ
jgi:hypothetical protein